MFAVTHLDSWVPVQCLQLNAVVCHFLVLIVLRLRWLWHMTQRFSCDVLSEDRVTALNMRTTRNATTIHNKCLFFFYVYVKITCMHTACKFSYQPLRYDMKSKCPVTMTCKS